MYNDIEINKIFNEEENEYYLGTISDDSINRVENKIGYKLPNSFKEFLKIRNGGRIKDYECWLTGIYGISKDENDSHSLENRYTFWIEEWEYPKSAVPFGDTESAGHDLYCFDYTNLNNNGEPKVVLIDSEFDNRVKVIADDFEVFIKMVYKGENITDDESSYSEPEKVVIINKSKDEIKSKKIVLGKTNNNIGLIIFGIICVLTGIFAISSYIIGGIFMIVFGTFCIFISILSIKNSKK